MDPNHTLEDALFALADAFHGDRRSVCGIGGEAVAAKRDAAELLRNLADWLDHGGFAPNVDKVLAKIQN